MDLLEKAARLGIDSSFIDGNGQNRTIGPDVLEAVLRALDGQPDAGMGVAPVVLRGSAPFNVAQVVALLSLRDDWTLLDQNGGVLAGARTQWDAPLPFGVYRIRSGSNDAAPDKIFIVAPPAAFGGDFDRSWLLAVQLYGVRSEHNWGIGDFSDLQNVLKWSASLGAAGVGLNPLHALFDDEPDDCSPYSPNSRLFLNSIYIDVAALPELPKAFVQENAELIDGLQRSELIDYPAVADLKRRALRLAFREFRSRTTLRRRTAFDKFRAARGVTLDRFACFEVLRRRHQGPWWDWPDPWKRPDDVALEQLRRGDEAIEIEFVEFVQWCAHEQLQSCARAAKELGLPVGLYLDVAVGVKSGGFDAWNEQEAISRKLSIGAPPDQLNTAGQDWGLAGYNAAGLAARSFTPFRDMLAESMQYAGAIRLDHVLGLNRIYVVPDGASPDRGAYIRMPFEAMLALVAIESASYRCVVIGEDLGTVPDGFRERMSEWGLWSYRVMMFERNSEGQFKAVDQYPADALVTFNTHDLPTFAGWRSAHDISLKRSLRIDPGESHDDRHHAVGLLQSTLRDAGHGDMHFQGVVRHLVDTPSRLLGVSVEDLMGVVDQINVPGTTTEHPNWRRRLPLAVEDWDRQIDTNGLRDALRNRSVSR